jgi:colanic acid/amylovoran biosynthesis protein
LKKILIDAYLEKNLGDDLFLKIVFDRYKNVEWHLLVNDKDYYVIFKDYSNVKVHYQSKMTKILNSFISIYSKKVKQQAIEFDALLKIGGSIFIEGKKWKKHIAKNKTIIKQFKKNNKKVFILGSNFGPYTKKEFLDSFRDIFNHCDDICFREQFSYGLFKEIENVRIAPDIVFSLEFPEINKREKTVGISIIDISKRSELVEYEELYISKKRDLIELFVDKGYEITLLSFCEAEGDMNAITKIKSGLDHKYLDMVNVKNYTGDIEEFLKTFSSLKSIIGCRFHSVILSQVFNQGLYPIIYSDKTYNVLYDLKLDEHFTYIRDLEKMNINEVVNIIQFNKLTSNEIKKKSQEQFLKLDQFIFGNK